MSEIVVVEGGVVQESTEGVIVIDLDNIKDSGECPNCGTYLDDMYCRECSVDWENADFAEIERAFNG